MHDQHGRHSRVRSPLCHQYRLPLWCRLLVFARNGCLAPLIARSWGPGWASPRTRWAWTCFGSSTMGRSQTLVRIQRKHAANHGRWGSLLSGQQACDRKGRQSCAAAQGSVGGSQAVRQSVSWRQPCRWRLCRGGCRCSPLLRQMEFPPTSVLWFMPKPYCGSQHTAAI